MFPALTSLGLSGGASSSAGGNEGSFFGGASGAGDWNVNVAGSGVAMQSGAGNMLLMAAVILAALWLLRK